VVYRLQSHVVLVTKYRKGVITDRVREALIHTAREVCERLGVDLIEADGDVDHLHLLVDYPPKLSMSAFVGAVKTNTSLRIRQKDFEEVTTSLWGKHFWSPSYFVCSVGSNTQDRVRRYIRDQRKPNRKPGRPKAS
jgi:putative transposase